MPATISASLRVAHERKCAKRSVVVGTKADGSPKYADPTALESLDGCTCRPSYYTLHRGADGRPIKSPRVRDREEAERALRKLLTEIDEGRAGVRKRPTRKTFKAWSDDYLAILEHDRRDKASTVRAYRSTIKYAEAEFGTLELSAIGPAELRAFVRAIRDNGGTDATVAKHLRHLGAILRAAEEEDLIERTPLTRKYVRSLKLKVPKGDEAYTDIELAKLWMQMEKTKTMSDGDERPTEKPVYTFIARAAVATGARLGELIAANLGDLDLLEKRLEIRHTWDPFEGLTLPKDGEARTVYLTPPAVELFARWLDVRGDGADDEPLFPAPQRGGEATEPQRVNGQFASRVVDRARKQVGISDIGEGGRKRKPFHAFRATFTRQMREQGRDPQWVQVQLGHSDPGLTLNVYGRWSDVAMQAEADRFTDPRATVPSSEGGAFSSGDLDSSAGDVPAH